MLTKILSHSGLCKRLIDNWPGMAEAVAMRRILLTGVLLGVAVLTLPAQLGSVPAGYSTHQSESYEIAFHYPDQWAVVERDDMLAVVNRSGLVDEVGQDEPDLQPGDVVVVLGVLPSMLMTMMGIPADDVGALADGMFENMLAESNELANAESGVSSYGGTEVASVVFDDPSEEVSGMVMVAREQEEVVVFSVALGFREDLRSEREALGRIVASTEYTGDIQGLMQ